jgi:hypothetical protein
VDDVIVKTRNSDTLIADLEETFASLREYRWKLNPNLIIQIPLPLTLKTLTELRVSDIPTLSQP